MKKFLLLAVLLPALAFGHGAPVIWNGTSAKWLPSGLQSAGVCKLSAAGVMSSSTVSDSELATSYIKADGTRALSGNWNAGANTITASTFIGALTGNASTATALASNPSDCAAGTKATAIDASGNLTCSASSLTADVSGILPLENGGTSKSIAVVPGGIIYTDTDSMEVGAAGTAGQAAISGGAGAPTWFAPTIGSVLFAGTGGILAQDNTNLFWDDTNNRLGIGIAAPQYSIHVKNAADSYQETIGLCYGAGSTCSSNTYSFYVSPGSNFYLRNGDQPYTYLQAFSNGRVSLAGADAAIGNAVLIRNQPSMTTDATLGLRKITSQTGDFLGCYDTDGTTNLCKVDISGAATFAGMTVSNLGAGVVHANSSGVLSSSAVDLAGGSSEVTGTLPVANGGTGQTSYTDGQLLIGNSSGNTLTKSTLTAGSNITITNGNGSISIAATGAGGCVQPVLTKTTDYTILTGDFTCANKVIMVECNCTVDCEITLPAASNSGFEVGLINIGSATCTAVAPGGDTFGSNSDTTWIMPAGGNPQTSNKFIANGGTRWNGF